MLYDTQRQSWRVINDKGPGFQPTKKAPAVLGLLDDKIFFLNFHWPVLRCFDLVLEDWVTLDVKPSPAQGQGMIGFMESIGSFVHWDNFSGRSVSELDLKVLVWNKHVTKGEYPMSVKGIALNCSHGTTIYVSWADYANSMKLYLLSCKERMFYWSRPEVSGRRPRLARGATLTYSSARLFRFGGSGGKMADPLQIYSIEESKWHTAETDNLAAEYSLHGGFVKVAAHSTVALRDRLVVFGGLAGSGSRIRVIHAVSRGVVHAVIPPAPH